MHTIGVAPAHQGRGHRPGAAARAARRGRRRGRRRCSSRSARTTSPPTGCTSPRVSPSIGLRRRYYPGSGADAHTMRREPRRDRPGDRDLLRRDRRRHRPRRGRRASTLLANEVASSVEEHARFGGVVPEVASRAHLQAMVPAVHRALATAGVTGRDVDAVAVTAGPGPDRRAAGRGGRGQGVRGGVGRAALRGQPPGRARRGGHPAARPAAAVPGAAGLRRPLQPARRARPGRPGHPARRHHRRRRRRGVRQGGPAARAAVPRRPAHRPGRPATATRPRSRSRAGSPAPATPRSTSRSPG